MRACLAPNVFLTASLSKSVLCHLYPHVHAVSPVSKERRNTHLAVSGKSFSKFKPSTSNQVVALLFHVMKAKSATVALSPTRYPEGRPARAASKTPKTRFISLSYRSTALGIFSLWNFWNHAAWPKYGLCVAFCHSLVLLIQGTREDEPLARNLEREPLKLEILVFADGGDLVFRIVLSGQVLDDRERFPMLCIPSE